MANGRKRAREVIDLEIRALEKVKESLGEGLDRAVEIILASLDSGGKIVVTGVGKSLHIGEKISATFASTGATSTVLNPMQAMHGDLGVIGEQDVLLALSYSGESEEILKLVPLIRRMGVPIASITGEPEGSLASNSDVVVSVAVDREACPFNMAPTASTTAMLAVGDALAMVLLQERGFKREDYAKLHPGGAIGRSLLLRVSDIMRSGERLAGVEESAKVKDALVAMTRARSGSACVVDKEGKLLGIFTDGDLRRNIAEKRELLDMPIREVMTKNPLTVKADELAVDALYIFQKHKVDDLIVVDDSGRPAGAVDIQDLPKLKIL
ncbi:MAG: KpsF/GutQ family sugar-phosphate isomerase [Kiritimatiellia bacterium]